MSAENEVRPVERYFVPGEFFIVLQLPDQSNGNDKGRIIEATQSFLSQTVGTTELSNSLDLLRKEIEEAARYPGERNELQYEEALRVVQMTSDAQEDIQSELNTALTNLQEDSVTLVGGRAHVFIQVQDGLLGDKEDERILACFTGALDLRVRQGIPIDQYTVVGASLNWLISSSQGNLTTGGPGAFPVPPSIKLDEQITEEDWEIIDISPQAVSIKKRLGTASVYILDTVPQYCQIRAALDKWKNYNGLIQSLLDSNFQGEGKQKPESTPDNELYYKYKGEPLTLHYYEKGVEDEVFQRPLDYGISEDDYEMPDHGLFIAGIIHAQAACARLHMIQVLNDYGVGSFGALLWGLEKVSLAIQAEEKAVVNCSLTFAADERSFKTDERPIAQFLPVLDLVLRKEIDGIVTEWYTRLIDDQYKYLSQRAVVLAAAGNDSRPGKERKPAKFPAAFANVHGVGALLSDLSTPAPYSNLADKPLADGFWTFGGDVNYAEADVHTGILGIYTSETFPGLIPTVNESGWARWAGTSFATAVVAGAYAERFCAGRSIQEAHCDLRKERYQGVSEQPFHLKRVQGRRSGPPPPR